MSTPPRKEDIGPEATIGYGDVPEAPVAQILAAEFARRSGEKPESALLLWEAKTQEAKAEEQAKNIRRNLDEARRAEAKLSEQIKNVEEAPHKYTIDGRRVTGRDIEAMKERLREIRGYISTAKEALTETEQYGATVVHEAYGYLKERGEAYRKYSEEKAAAYKKYIREKYEELPGYEKLLLPREEPEVVYLTPSGVPPGPAAGPAPGSVGERVKRGVEAGLAAEEQLFKVGLRGISESAEQLYLNAVEAKSRGLDVEAGAAYGASAALRGVEAFVTGATFAVRPKLVGESVVGVAKLAVSPEARAGAVEAFKRDPLGALVSVPAGYLGGAAFDAALRSGVEKATELTRVKATQLQAVKVRGVVEPTREVVTEVTPEVTRKSILMPKVALEEFPEEADTLLGVADEVAGYKLTLGEADVERLFKGEKVVTRGARGEIISVPEDRVLFAEKFQTEAGKEYGRFVKTTGLEAFKEVGVETPFPPEAAKAHIDIGSEFKLDVTAIAKLDVDLGAEAGEVDDFLFLEAKKTGRGMKPLEAPKPKAAKPTEKAPKISDAEAVSKVEKTLKGRAVFPTVIYEAEGYATGARLLGGALASYKSATRDVSIQRAELGRLLEQPTLPSLDYALPSLADTQLGRPVSDVGGVDIEIPRVDVGLEEVTLQDVDLDMPEKIKYDYEESTLGLTLPDYTLSPPETPRVLSRVEKPRKKRVKKKPRRGGAEKRRLPLPSWRQILKEVL